MIRCKPFREDHVDLFQCQDEHLSAFQGAMPLLIKLGQLDQCGVHIVDGRILFIGGWYEAAPGVAELYIYPSIYTREYARLFYLEAKFWVKHLKAQYRRVQCWGEDTPLSRRWLSKIGFTLEGVLPDYCGPGVNMLVWGKTDGKIPSPD